MNTTSRLTLLSLLAGSLSACLLRVPADWDDDYEPPPAQAVHGAAPVTPGAAPAAQPMSYQEAVGWGAQYCAQRGYGCQLRDAHLSGRRVWKLRYTATRDGQWGDVRLEVDAWSRVLLHAREKFKAPRHHDHDDDDDD